MRQQLLLVLVGRLDAIRAPDWPARGRNPLVSGVDIETVLAVLGEFDGDENYVAIDEDLDRL